MKHYFVTTHANENGEHVIHEDECSIFPKMNTLEDLGYFYGYNDAFRDAKRKHKKWRLVACSECCGSDAN
ncbi:hypothetical protein [Geotoga petraea]|uniref:Uncharacterized protein n=1 Tax=Geotoga petraea TaxID=28234 RepID=A0A4Z0VVJ6_9BACT|nr:hypothetical protein [Geotoga petraea]MDK2946407.1 hypothetical protein [Geotoga sp.]TGG87978.1 hypothetical protein E4650_06445 [Geotoga petraea]